MARARYIMVGGFLGAGKTTAMGRLARHLTEKKNRVGLITNDQSHGLVDTVLLRSQGYKVEEITGGCFCCRFKSLNEAADRLNETDRPDVFLAEPVGSCTDLVATVSYPLRRMYGDKFSVAPLSVLVDPKRASRILGLIEGRSFSEKVVYVYRKQLEEAHWILVNKSDSIEPELRDALVDRLSRDYPKAKVLSVSAKTGEGLLEWFDSLDGEELVEHETMSVDYDRYAEGEALLGWLNATYDIKSAEPFDANGLLLGLCRDIKERLSKADGEVAHLKMTLEDPDAGGQLSVVSVVRDDDEPDLRESLVDRTRQATLILNLRAEAPPEVLKAVASAAIDAIARIDGLTIELEHLECFEPGRPTPTHRISFSS